MDENKNGIEELDDPATLEELEKGKDSVKEAKELLPADLWPIILSHPLNFILNSF